MFIFGIIFLVVFLILIGVGLALGILIFAAASTAVGFGLISTSVACGIIQKKPSTGFRIFFYQFFIVTFLITGVAATWLVSFLGNLQIQIVPIILIGTISGISIGLIFGLLHSYIVSLIATHLRRIFPQTTNAA